MTEDDGYAERAVALAMLGRSIRGPAAVGEDRDYDTHDFVWDVLAPG